MCSTCDWRRPDLDDANADIWAFWLEVQTQWRQGFGGPTGLDYTAVRATADLMEIEITPRLWRGIQALESETLRHHAEHDAHQNHRKR